MEDRNEYDPTAARKRAEVEASKLANPFAGQSRDMIGGGCATTAGPMKDSESAGSLDRRIERAIERAKRKSNEAANSFYEANQLAAFLDCLPRRLPEAAAEGLRIILDRAGF